MSAETRGKLLVGCGKMGGAMLAGWLASGDQGPFVIVDPAGAPGFAGKPHVSVLTDAAAIDPGFTPSVVVIAVKPQMMGKAIPPIRRFAGPDTVFLSIAAGTTIENFRAHFGPQTRIVRAMPNTPAQVGRGISIGCPGPGVSDAQRAECERLLGAVGAVGWVAEERLIDAVTAVSGSGPAYVFLLVECLAQAGREVGLPDDLAQKLARATIEGAGELLHQSPETPATLRQNVTSPNGTTAAALAVLMAPDGLQPLLSKAVAAAERRARELAG
jgi:pyrroline-5-carboxylate reductase